MATRSTNYIINQIDKENAARSKRENVSSGDKKDIQAAQKELSYEYERTKRALEDKSGAGRGQGYVEAPAPNSRAQYNAEKAAGGAQTDLSYEEWKKLD
jgi:hypothetical protein